jgi:Uma2 family endonuclease
MREARHSIVSSTGARTSALPTSVDAFLAWAETQEFKHEYVDGLVVMQTGASRDHEQVAKRVFVSLFRQVDGSEFDVNKGDFGVRLAEGRGEGSVLLPDVLVDLRDARGEEHATTTPIVVIEVLSPSTDLAHHVDELRRYSELPSLIHYVVFSQDGPEAHVWRKDGGVWPANPNVVQGADAVIPFPEIGATLLLSDVYRHLQPRATPHPR